MALPKLVEIWVPHRISGFFQMMNPEKSSKIRDPKAIGSRGGGPALDAYIKTELVIEKNSDEYSKEKLNSFKQFELNNQKFLRIKININNIDKTEEAQTSLTVLEHILENNRKIISNEIDTNDLLLTISHSIDLPIGCGYGSSGGGALGIAYGLNILFDLGLSLMDASKYAHIAEVENHTGLGTVGGQVVGGFSLSMQPGFPYQMDKIVYDENLRVVICSFGAISTKSILTDPEYKKLIHNTGKEGMKKMREKFSVHNFIYVCRQFIKQTQMLSKLQLDIEKKLISELNGFSLDKNILHRPFGASLNQLGRSVFCICDESIENEVQGIMKKYNPTHVLKSLKINASGPIVKQVIY